MDEGTRYLILSLEGERYALPIARLIEITVPRGIEKETGLTEVFEGKSEFRGKKIPVLNIKKILKLAGKPGSVLLVLSLAKGVLGVLVDAVNEIIDAGQKPAPLPKGILNPSLVTYAGVIRHQGDLILALNEDGLLQ